MHHHYYIQIEILPEVYTFVIIGEKKFKNTFDQDSISCKENFFLNIPLVCLFKLSSAYF